VALDEFLENPESCNCELYAAGVQRALGFFIPDQFRSSDFADDTAYTKRIDYIHQPIQTGDIIGLWRKGETNTKRIHLGVLRWNKDEEIVEVIHASKDKKSVVVSHIGALLLDPKYESIAFIKRATFRKRRLHNPHQLRELGFSLLAKKANVR